MKKSNLFLFVVMIFLISCGSQEEQRDNASIEPNNTIEEANTIDLGFEFAMKIHEDDDVDWYEVEVPGQGYLTVAAKGVPSELDLSVRFATYEEWESNPENFITSNLKLPASVSIIEEGTYFVRVSDRYSRNSSDEEFMLRIDFTEEFDKFEPNQSPQEAKLVEFGVEYESAIFPIGDEDWFKVNVKEQGYLSVRARNVPDNLELATYFATYDEYSSQKINTIKGKGELPQNIAITEPGEYYIVLCDRWDRYASKELFTWTVDFIEEMDIYEPNNTHSDAKEIQPNDTIEIAIFPIGDQDFFKINFEEEGKLTIRAGSHGIKDLTAKIHKLDTLTNKYKTVATYYSFPVTHKVEEIETAYYIEFYDRWNRHASPDLFNLIFSFE